MNMNYISFQYTGNVQIFTAPNDGLYTLECWGAQGGSYSTTYQGGCGGYSKGTINLRKNDTLFIYVGGQPTTNSSTAGNTSSYGGFNGGGNSKTYAYGGTYTIGQGGGGATDIRVGTDSLYARVIVAGGGAGSTNRSASSNYYGGGYSSGGYSSSYIATQESPGTNGSFGLGANAKGGYNYKYGPPGAGGGWYGGGVSTTASDSSTACCRQVGGGSGYVYTESTKSYYPTGCLLNETYLLTDVLTIGGIELIPNKVLGEADTTGNSGHGMVRITNHSNSSNVFVKVAGQWRKGSPYVKVAGQWRKATNLNIKVAGQWRKS